MARAKKAPVVPAETSTAGEFDLFTAEKVREFGPSADVDKVEEGRVKEETKAHPFAAAVAPSEVKPECNEGCPKFHRPDPECVKCFNENFRR